MSNTISKLLSEIENVNTLNGDKSINLKACSAVYQINSYLYKTINKGLDKTDLANFLVLKQSINRLIDTEVTICKENIDRLQELLTVINTACEDKDKLGEVSKKYLYIPQNSTQRGLNMCFLINTNKFTGRAR